MKIKIVINAPEWSADDAEAFVKPLGYMISDYSQLTLKNFNPAFIEFYDFEEAKKKVKRKTKKVKRT